MANIPDYLELLKQLHPLAEMLWLYDQQGFFFVIKVPSGVRFKDLALILEKPRIFEEESTSDHPEIIVELLYSTRTSYRVPAVSHSCLFRIQPGITQKLTRQLSKEHLALVRVIFYSEGQNPKKLGEKMISWHAIPRNALKKVTTRKDSATANSVAQVHSINNIPLMTLSDVRQRFATFFNLRGLITPQTAQRQSISLKIFMVLPEETHFKTVAVAFEALNWWTIPTGQILSLRCILQDGGQRQLAIECIIDPLRERNVLQLMSTMETIEVMALGNSHEYPHLGRKQFPWPQSKRTRAQDLLAVSRMAAPPTAWRESLVTFLQKARPATTFKAPGIHYSEDIRSDQRFYQIDVFQGNKTVVEHQHIKEITMEDTNQALIPALSEQLTSPTLKTSLIERSILLHQAGARQEFARLGTFSRGIFWRLLFALALEQTPRKYIWTSEAVALIEEHRQQLIPDSRIPWFPSHEHVWIEFSEPITTLVGFEIAALTLFASDDTRLLQRLQQHMGIRSNVLTRLDQTLYTPDKHHLIFNVIDNTGRIVWAIGLNTGRETRPDTRSEVWGTAPWFFCPNPQCLLHTKAASTLCESCTTMRTFVWTWLLAAQQSLLGLYREQPDEAEQIAEGYRHEKPEQTSRILTSSPENEKGGLLKTQQQYRVVRSIDIAIATERESTSSQTQRGSWVEALAAIDPALLFIDEREIPLTTRTLKDPRYARYIAEHGTNQIEVKAHTRHIPMRADPKRMTRVTARKKLDDPGK
jgi:hypothetical protein